MSQVKYLQCFNASRPRRLTNHCHCNCYFSLALTESIPLLVWILIRLFKTDKSRSRWKGPVLLIYQILKVFCLRRCLTLEYLFVSPYELWYASAFRGELPEAPQLKGTSEEKYCLYSFSCLGVLFVLFSPWRSAEAFCYGQLSSVVMLVSVFKGLLCVILDSRKEKYLNIYFRAIQAASSCAAFVEEWVTSINK